MKTKKSFILYLDQQELFNKLPDEMAGKLIKHIFSYVNCEDPELDDLLLDIAFSSIKQSLKRDLDKWETQLKQRSEAGKKSAEKRANEKQRKATSVKSRSTKSTDSVNVSVSVNDSVSDIKDKTPVFNFKKSFLELGVEEQVLNDWIKVRDRKKAPNTQTVYKSIVKQINLSNLSANECITLCAEKAWLTFKAEWIDNLNRSNNGNQRFKQQPTENEIPIEVTEGFQAFRNNFDVSKN